MIRWIRIAAIGLVALAMIAAGVAVGLFLIANNRWVPVQVPEWLHWAFGEQELEVWLPAVLGGWVVVVLALAALLVWSMYYVWKRRQYESLIAVLERELAMLRNLPFTRPAPLEDLPEERDEDGARLAAAAAQVDAELGGEAEREEPEP